MNIELIITHSYATLPLFFLLIVGLALMLMDAFDAKSGMPWIAGFGLVGSAVLAQLSNATPGPVFNGMIMVGGLANLVHIFLCVSAFFVLFFVQDYLARQAKPVYEVYPLLIFSVVGMIMMANAGDLMMTFVGLETFSISLYIFAALFKTDARSNEAGLKYFLLGAFASAFLLFGISLIYGISGTTNLVEISKMINAPADVNVFAKMPTMFLTAVGLLLIGFLFKVSAFPFHNWTPDVYEGTPTPLAGFMATGSKMAVFVSLATVLSKLHFTEFSKLVGLIATAALLTMMYGNIVAARQTNLKRMLAYSSIAHSGYVLLGLCAGDKGIPAVIFYMFVYTIMNVGAFGLVGMAEDKYSDTNIENWRGLGMKSPVFAAAMSVFLFSLAGIPPLAGFMSKYYVFISAIKSSVPILIVVLGILTSVVAAYYYIYIIVIMYFGNNEEPKVHPVLANVPMFGVLLLVALVLILGVNPSAILTPITNMFGNSGIFTAGLF